MFWFVKKKKVFYDPDKCERIIFQYNAKGGKDLQILRALAMGDLKPSDIRKYCVYGESYPSCYLEEYRLIDQIARARPNEYTVRNYDSGSYFSKLDKVELSIVDGVGHISRYWVPA